MNFFELIESRHSCREFTSQPVEKEKLNLILEAIRLAPTAGNLQAYAVRVVTDYQILGSLSAAAWMQSFIAEAPLVLVFYAVPELSAAKYGERGIHLYCIQDATIACTYAQLAATDLGLASCWVGAFDSSLIKKCVGGDWSWKPVAMLPIGYSVSNILTNPLKSDRVQLYDCNHNDWRSR